MREASAQQTGRWGGPMLVGPEVTPLPEAHGAGSTVSVNFLRCSVYQFIPFTCAYDCGFFLRNLQLKLSLQEDVPLLFCIWGTSSHQLLRENVTGTGSMEPGLKFQRKPGRWAGAAGRLGGARVQARGLKTLDGEVALGVWAAQLGPGMTSPTWAASAGSTANWIKLVHQTQSQFN